MSNEFTLHLNAEGTQFSCSVKRPGEPRYHIYDEKSKQKETTSVMSYIDEASLAAEKELAPNEVLSLDSGSFNISINDGKYYLEFNVYRCNIDGIFVLSKDSTIVIEIDDANIPAVIKEAMSCKSRTEVLAYIKSNLITAVPSADNRKYQINTPNDTNTLVALYHRHFRSDESELSGHYCIKGAAHKDTPQGMYDFVEARERLYNESFEAGRRYKETSWINPSWVSTNAGNKIKSLENSVARSLFGLFLPAKSSRHCEDFEKGVKAARQ